MDYLVTAQASTVGKLVAELRSQHRHCCLRDYPVGTKGWTMSISGDNWLFAIWLSLRTLQRLSDKLTSGLPLKPCRLSHLLLGLNFSVLSLSVGCFDCRSCCPTAGSNLRLIGEVRQS
jgi:hypothetical protein